MGRLALLMTAFEMGGMKNLKLNHDTLSKTDHSSHHSFELTKTILKKYFLSRLEDKIFYPNLQIFFEGTDDIYPCTLVCLADTVIFLQTLKNT
jgi:hypothetical protein